ncbi:MAG: PmoA family protein [Candidatus Handelsmanbacteria bacterium]|nr:PmoA family protein [Candidatus Handelsmanbacteria bacterium]
MSVLESERGAEKLVLRRPGAPAPLLVQNAPAHQRPFIHPLAAPDGQGELTEDMPAHHPWQRGLYVGLNEVGGFGFWKQGTGAAGESDGTFHPQPLVGPAVDGAWVVWQVRSQWRAPGGAPLGGDPDLAPVRRGRPL